MIAYFDTSALVPLLVDEPASSRAMRLWREATRVASVRLLYPEARAALARARRMERISSDHLRSAVTALGLLDRKLDHVQMTARLSVRAGHLAEATALRGYDAVHLAAAETLADGELVFVTGDLDLAATARNLGLATANLS